MLGDTSLLHYAAKLRGSKVAGHTKGELFWKSVELFEGHISKEGLSCTDRWRVTGNSDLRVAAQL